MTTKTLQKKQRVRATLKNSGTNNFPFVCTLTPSAEPEVLDFLAKRPIHTFGLNGLIQQYGLEADAKRGTYFGCRDEAGALEGVALIGHFTLFETLTDRALKAFANVAQHNEEIHLMLGEQEKMNKFLGFFNQREACQAQALRYLQLEINNIDGDEFSGTVLRPATPADLSQVVVAHAQVLYEDRGVDRLKVEPETFQQNCLDRINQQKTWVLEKDGKVLFKAELTTDSPEVVYLEGVWVDEEERGLGHGYRCLSQFIKNLLNRTTSVCLLLGEKNKTALSLYEKVGFQHRGYYQAVFP